MEENGLTCEKASEQMDGVSASRIEKIEYNQQEPTPYDVIQMASCYNRLDLCKLLLLTQMLYRRKICPGGRSNRAS